MSGYFLDLFKEATLSKEKQTKETGEQKAGIKTTLDCDWLEKKTSSEKEEGEKRSFAAKEKQTGGTKPRRSLG